MMDLWSLLFLRFEELVGGIVMENNQGENNMLVSLIAKEVRAMRTTDTEEKVDDSQILSAGDIDVRYMKLLRARGEREVTEYYEIGKRFAKLDPVSDDGKITIYTRLQKPRQEHKHQTEIECFNRPSHVNKIQRMRFGVLSQPMLQPEGSIREQPLRKKKSKISDVTFADGSSKSIERGTSRLASDIYGTVARDTFAKTTVRNFIVYLIFLVIVNIITFGVQERTYDYYADELSELLTQTFFSPSIGVENTFDRIRQVQEIWHFIYQVLCRSLQDYSSDHLIGTGLVTNETEEEGLVLFENILVGVPRIRQQRVRNDSCKTHEMFGDRSQACYYYFSDENEDKEPFGLNVPTAWTYAAPDADSSRYHGKISSYGGGGYMMNITREPLLSTDWLEELEGHSWIREGTRVVFVDFTTYTPNTNLFCVVKLVFELPPTGGVITSSHVSSMKFLRYVNSWDQIVLCCEIVFLCYVVYFTMEVLQHLIISQEEYFYSWWNFIDLLIVAVSYSVVVTGWIRFVAVTTHMDEKVSHIDSKTHASFDNFVDAQKSFDTTLDVLTFLVWLKLLKYASLNKTVALILSIFGSMKLKLIVLSTMMFTMVIGFALVGIILFGTQVELFSTFWSSVFSLVTVFVGGLHFYRDCASARPYIAPVFFLLYIYTVFILMLSAYVAIIVLGFHDAVVEFKYLEDKMYSGDVFRTLLYKTLRFVKKNELAQKMRSKYKDKKNRKDYDDLVQIMKKHGLRDLDLAMMMKKHDITPGNSVSFEKMSQVYNEMDARTLLLTEVDEHERIMSRLVDVGNKVEHLDQSVAGLEAKLETLMNRHLHSLGRMRT